MAEMFAGAFLLFLGFLLGVGFMLLIANSQGTNDG